MAMKGPGLFSDIGKKQKDLLNKDYNYDHKLTIATLSASGVGLTSTAVKKGNIYALDIGSQYKYKNAILDVKVDTDSNIATTLIISEILPYTKAITSLKLPDVNSGKLEVQYFHDNASVTAAFSLKQNPLVELSTTFGTKEISFGGEASYDTANGNFTKYTAGFGLTKPDYITSLHLADKGDTLKAAYMHHLGETHRASAVIEITRRLSTNENTVTVGTACAVDPQTTFKARLNNTGKLATLLQHEVKPKSFLTLSGEFDTKALDRAPKFGLALLLKP